jgi:6-phosphogluconolactonase (cycloisomerase 2 family)
VFAPQTNGSLSFVQLAPAGGRFPRQFQLNKAGDKLVTGLQQSARVVVIERDVATGKFGNFLANITVPGQVTTTVWDE